MSNDVYEKLKQLESLSLSDEDAVKQFFICPLFALLGFERGTSNDIEEEASIQTSLATNAKKSDYILSNAGNRAVAAEVRFSPKQRFNGVRKALVNAQTEGIPLILYADAENIAFFNIDDINNALFEVRRGDLSKRWEGVKRYLSPDNLSLHMAGGNIKRFFEVPPDSELELSEVYNVGAIKDFFKGHAQSWLPAQTGISAPQYLENGGQLFSIDDFIKYLLEFQRPRSIKIFGPGGSGKTTFARKIALELSRDKRAVLFRKIIGKKCDYESIRNYAQRLEEFGRRLFLIYDNPTLYNHFGELIDMVGLLDSGKLGDSVILMTERKREWLSQLKRYRGVPGKNEKTFYLSEKIDEESAGALSDAVRRVEERGIAALPEGRDAKALKDDFIRNKGGKLLLAVCEAMTGLKIEEILKNEHENIQNEKARALSELICFLYAYNMWASVDLGKAVLGGNKEFREAKKNDLAGIIYEKKWKIFPRHRTLAEILWKTLNPDSEKEIHRLEKLLRELRYSQFNRENVNLNGFSRELTRFLLNSRRFEKFASEYYLNIWESLADCSREKRHKSIMYTQLGGYFQRRGKKDDALKSFEKGVETAPDVALYSALGHALLERGRDEEAIEIFQRGLEKTPSHKIYTALGQTLLGQGRDEEAIEILRTGAKNLFKVF